MAVYLHSVTAADVIAQLPAIDKPGSITSTSQGLNTTQIDAWIEEAAATVNAALEQHGYTDIPVQLTDNAAAICRHAIIAYALWMCLLTTKGAQRAELYKARWDAALERLDKMPEALGAAQPLTAQVHSNLNPADPAPNPWSRAGWRGW